MLARVLPKIRKPQKETGEKKTKRKKPAAERGGLMHAIEMATAMKGLGDDAAEVDRRGPAPPRPFQGRGSALEGPRPLRDGEGGGAPRAADPRPPTTPTDGGGDPGGCHGGGASTPRAAEPRQPTTPVDNGGDPGGCPGGGASTPRPASPSSPPPPIDGGGDGGVGAPRGGAFRPIEEWSPISLFSGRSWGSGAPGAYHTPPSSSAGSPTPRPASPSPIAGPPPPEPIAEPPPPGAESQTGAP